jgi:hypothetical protein
VPPLEGPPRGAAEDVEDFRDLPEWQLPVPEDLSPPPTDATGAEFNPPAEPAACPDGWSVLARPDERFEVCHPPDWRIEGHGYVSSPGEDRWYSVGIVKWEGTEQLAHVSVYMFPPGARPVRYTIECPQPYAVTFAGEPAVLCADFPGEGRELRAISYHVVRDEQDYFDNAVPYEGSSQEDLDLALQIAGTFRFTSDEPAVTANP